MNPDNLRFAKTHEWVAVAEEGGATIATVGISAFAVEAFAARDRAWARGDARAISLNDLLQYLGQLAFRAPVPAYKHSAAQYLHLRGIIQTDRPHPRSLKRPASDVALLADIAARVDAAVALSAESAE